MTSSTAISLCSLYLFLHAALSAHYVPNDVFFLNCGAEAPATVGPERHVWVPDVNSKFVSAPNSTASVTTSEDPTVPQIPYMTARVSQSDSAVYTFPVVPGRKFVRLHFYPSSYNNLSASDAAVTVSANGVSLLKNFNASLFSETLNLTYVMKEFSVPVAGKTLTLTFSPSKDCPNTYGYVNGIEVVSMP